MEDLNSQNKARQVIIKNKQLLDEKKYYEFGQKIKLITHRKIQGKRFEEAQKILLAVLEHLYAIKEVQDNICFELLQILVDLLKNHHELITIDTQKKLLSVLGIRGINSREVACLMELIRAVKKPSAIKVISEGVVRYRIQNQEFAAAERIAADLDRELALNFVKDWCTHPELLEDEKPAIWARMILCRAATINLQEAQAFLAQIPETYTANPYIKFSKVLLQTAQIKSNEAYNLIQKSYSQFLEEDFIFKGLYNSIGAKYFNKKSESSGLLALFN